MEGVQAITGTAGRNFATSRGVCPVRVMAMAAAALVAVAVGLVLIPRASNASRVYAAAAQQLRSSRSLEYTIVLNDTPYVAVDFSYAAPGYKRLNCSWGIEVRADGTAGRQIVLMHLTRMYLAESGKQVEGVANSDDMMEQLLSLPPTADQVLGEKIIHQFVNASVSCTKWRHDDAFCTGTFRSCATSF